MTKSNMDLSEFWPSMIKATFCAALPNGYQECALDTRWHLEPADAEAQAGQLFP